MPSSPPATINAQPPPILWAPVQNTYTESVPPFAAMEPTGFILGNQQDRPSSIQITRPRSSGLTNVLFNGPSPIPAGAYGSGHQCFPGIAAYLPAAPDTLVAMGFLGTDANSWVLSPDRSGFQSLGGSTGGLTNIIRHIWGQFRFTEIKTADYTAQPWDAIPVNCVAGSVTITMPSTPSVGCQVKVIALNTYVGGTTYFIRTLCTGTAPANRINGAISTVENIFRNDDSNNGGSWTFTYTGRANVGWEASRRLYL